MFGTRLISLVAILPLAVASCLDIKPLDPDKPPPAINLENVIQAPTCAGGEFETSAMDLKMTVIDVGQGDAILIQTPDDGIPGNGVAEGYNILVDAGDGGWYDTNNGGDVVADRLRKLGIGQIDYAVVSHAHSDHYGGMATLFKTFTIVNVIDPGYTAEASSYTTYLDAAYTEVARSGGQLFRPDGTDADGDGTVDTLIDTYGNDEGYWPLDLGDEMDVRVIHARPVLGTHGDLDQGEGTQINNTSVVIRIVYQGASIMLMADAENEVEDYLENSGFDLSANILKVGHHGSNSSTSIAFVGNVFGGTGVGPEIPRDERYAVISSGRTSFNGVQLPTGATFTRLLQAVDSDHLFSTENGDEEKIEIEAAGDDTVMFAIKESGEVLGCYL